MDTTGFYYNGPGPASSVNILFWKSKGTLPNAKKAAVERDNLPAANLDTGAFQIALPKSCKVSLKGGKKGTTYWVTVQANLAGFNTSGYWAWGTDPAVQGNQAAGYWYGGSVQTDNPACNTSFQTSMSVSPRRGPFLRATGLGQEVIGNGTNRQIRQRAA